MKRLSIVFLAALLLMTALTAWAGAEEAEAAPEAAEEAPDREPLGYVLVTTNTAAGWLPLPLDEDTVWPVRQTSPDGTEYLNVLHLMPDGMYVEEASCENHDCVEQGTVTFDNREERILGNMIICLPNQVVFYLYTPEEVQELVDQGFPSPFATEE